MEVVRAFRLRSKEIHPDRTTNEEERAHRTEAFKVLNTAKEILVHPIMANQYREWAQQQAQAQAAARGRPTQRPAQEKNHPTSRWPPAPAPGAAKPSSSASSSQTPPPAAHHARFEEARARFSETPRPDPGADGDGFPRRRAPGDGPSRAAPKPPAPAQEKPEAQKRKASPSASTYVPPRNKKAPPPPQRPDGSEPAADAAPKKAAPPPQRADGSEPGRPPRVPRGSVGRAMQESASADPAGSEGYRRPEPARPIPMPAFKRARPAHEYRGGGQVEDLRIPRATLEEPMEADESGGPSDDVSMQGSFVHLAEGCTDDMAESCTQPSEVP